MIKPSMRSYRFTKVVDYSELIDLGRPYSSDPNFSGTGNVGAYRNNVWCMYLFDNKIYIGAGNSTNSKPGDNTPGGWAIRAIDTADDSVITYPTTNMQAREIGLFQEVDGKLFAPDFDSHNDASSYVYRLDDVSGTPTFVRYKITDARNHNYYIYKTRRGSRWFSAHGWTTVGQNSFTNASSFEGYPVNWDSAAPSASGSRGMAILEFGPTETSRIILVSMQTPYRDSSSPGNAGTFARDPLSAENQPASSFVFLSEVTATSPPTYTYHTNYQLSGLHRGVTHPRFVPNSAGSMFHEVELAIVLQNITRVDDDTYIAVIGRASGNVPRVLYPGMMGYRDLGGGTYVDYLYHGGIYYITLGSEKSWSGAHGNTFLQCTRALPYPEETGRQWNYHLVGTDLYVLTETPDLRCHIYKNGKKILTITGLPTFARSLCIVGPHLYIGLGSDEYDPYRRNETTLNINSGRILKVENFED